MTKIRQWIKDTYIVLSPLKGAAIWSFATRMIIVVLQWHSFGFASISQIFVGLANDLFIVLLFMLAIVISGGLFKSNLLVLRICGWFTLRISMFIALIIQFLMNFNLVNIAYTGNNASLEEFSYLNPRDFPLIAGSFLDFFQSIGGVLFFSGGLLAIGVTVWVAKGIKKSLAELDRRPSHFIYGLAVALMIIGVTTRSYSLTFRQVLFEPIESHIVQHLIENLQTHDLYKIERPDRGLRLLNQRLIQLGAIPLDNPLRPMLNYRNFRTQPLQAVTSLGMPPSLPPKTNVVYLLLESFGHHILQKQASTAPWTEALFKSGVTLRQHYTNAFRTVGAQFSALCSQHNPPLFYVSREFPNTHLLCLPEILKNQGYFTLNVSGTSLTSDYDGIWFKANAFDRVISEDDFPPDSDRFSYGIHDGPVYAKLLSELDNIQDTKKPFFAYLSTVSTHHPYTVPPWYLKAHPEIANFDPLDQSFFYASEQLKNFFVEAKTHPWFANTLFVIFGDHANWGFNGGSPTDPDFDRTKERYHTIASFIHPKLKPVDYTMATDHTNLAPTVLDLLGIKAQNELIGQSIYMGPYQLIGSQENNRNSFYTLHNDQIAIFRDSISRQCQMIRKGDATKINACDTEAWKLSEDFKALFYDTIQWEVLQLQTLKAM